MSSTPERRGGFVSYSLLMTLILPAVSFIIVFSGGEGVARLTSPPPLNAVANNQAEATPQVIVTVTPLVEQPTPLVEQPTPQQAQQAPIVSTASMPVDRPDTSDEFRAIYGDQLYPTLDSMPADLLSWYLYWVQRVALYYDVPEEDLLAVHYAELMGNGFRPLETRRSSARAAGPGQIIPQTWNGWSCGRNQTVFMTDPLSIQNCGGLGTDFDGDGIASVDSLPDNLAATARHIKADGISTALRSDQVRHESMLREALAQYNANRSYWQASRQTQRYADIGVNWMRDNRELVPVYIAVYVHPV
ncbi:MAG TPA: hypothetical protein V6D17_13405 [Candidatus Obscuribacterales bacterium]